MKLFDIWYPGKLKDTNMLMLLAKVRYSASYQQQHFMWMDSLFKVYSPSQLFITLTCNINNPIYHKLNDHVHGKNPPPIQQDPQLITMGFEIEILSNIHFIKNSFSHQYCGGLPKAWYYMMELQSSDLPHIHLCLWTELSVDDLAHSGVVMASLGAYKRQVLPGTWWHAHHRFGAMLPEAQVFTGLLTWRPTMHLRIPVTYPTWPTILGPHLKAVFIHKRAHGCWHHFV